MNMMFLYIYLVTSIFHTDVLVWIFGVIVLLVAFVLLFSLKKTKKRLTRETEMQDDINSTNIEYELVLKGSVCKVGDLTFCQLS